MFAHIELVVDGGLMRKRQFIRFHPAFKLVAPSSSGPDSWPLEVTFPSAEDAMNEYNKIATLLEAGESSWFNPGGGNSRLG